MASELTVKDGRKAARWFLRVQGMTDWVVQVYVSNEPPAWVADSDGLLGENLSDAAYKLAKVWVGPGRHAVGDDPLDTLFHELGHMLMADIGVRKDSLDAVQYQLWRLGRLWAAAYRAGVKTW